MSKAGWYSDPGGAPGMFRYWDGQAWSASITPNPFSPPPVSGAPINVGGGFGANEGVNPNPYAITGGADAPRQRAWGAWAIVGVVLVAIIVGIVAVANNAGLNPFSPTGPVSNPTADFCPKKKAINPTATQTPQPAGRVQGGKLSYPRLGSPWGAPEVEDRVPFGQDVYEQVVMLHDNYNGLGNSWVASVLVGELVSGDGFFSPQQGSEIVSKCVMGVFYGDAVLQRTDVVNQAAVVDGKDAWLLEMHLGFNIDGLDETGETAIIVVVKTGSESASLYYASVPDSRPDLLQTARGVQKQLKVES